MDIKTTYEEEIIMKSLRKDLEDHIQLHFTEGKSIREIAKEFLTKNKECRYVAPIIKHDDFISAEVRPAMLVLESYFSETYAKKRPKRILDVNDRTIIGGSILWKREPEEEYTMYLMREDCNPLGNIYCIIIGKHAHYIKSKIEKEIEEKENYCRETLALLYQIHENCTRLNNTALRSILNETIQLKNMNSATKEENTGIQLEN